MPAYHPEWLVTFWLSTPGLNLLDPHLTLIVIFAALITLLIYKRKKHHSQSVVDGNEEKFQLLLNQKKLIEVELKELDIQLESKEITEEQFTASKHALEKHLQKTMNQLKQFTL